ncbi:MAG: hypothetical protein V8Q36_10815 [Anaerotignum sp.]
MTLASVTRAALCTIFQSANASKGTTRAFLADAILMVALALMPAMSFSFSSFTLI